MSQHENVRKYTQHVLEVVIMLRIGEAREARGWTQAQLAHAIGTTQQTVQRWESGETEPKVSQVEAVSHALGITMSFLLGMDAQQKTAEAVTRSQDENTLLLLFRKMNAQGRERLMEQAAFLAERHPKNQASAMGA